jgi:hypothetical protein
MSTLLYGVQRTETPSDIEHVRTTVTVVEDDAAPAMQAHAPDWNEYDTDPDTGGGLTARQLGSHVVPSSRYVPAIGNANEDLNGIVDRQVSTSGTAAAREASGQWGHGTMQVIEGIEPAIVDGQAFGETYFKAHPRPDNPNGGDYMSPAQTSDPATIAAAQATGENLSRSAVQASIYSAFYAAQTGTK